MRTAIIHDYLNQYGGAERVLECLHQLYPGAPVYTIIYDPARMPQRFRSWEIRPSWVNRLPGVRRHYEKMIPLFPYAIESLDLSDYDLVISLSSAWAKGVLTTPQTLHVCVCTSPMRFAWDEYHQRLRHSNPLLRPALAAALHRIRIWDVASSARPDHYVAISDVVARRIGTYWRRPATVIRPGIDTGFFTPGTAATGGYYLAASRLKPYKRVDLAVRAFTALGLPLVVAGDGPERSALERIAGPSVTFLGRVSDERLRELYRCCRAFIFPTNEDFGLTPLEAQACGRPVIAYGRGGALETVVEGRTGLFFGEQTADALARAVQAFEAMTFDPAQIRRHAESFDQSLFAQRLKTFIEQQCEAHQR
ncbi:MAG TPA: glycosyltransferase [Candidatus Edwardsbacteria bacterium]|nr:glycosyltransferase [Candidatus Edwardsbacteria bacterium]